MVREGEGVDRIRERGRWRRVRIQEGRRVGPCRPDGGTAAVHGIAGDAAGGGRPREGDPCGGHAGGLEAGGGGGRHGRRRGSGMEDGAHRVPVGGGGEGGRPVLAARGARRDVLFERGFVRSLRPRRVRPTDAASGHHRARRPAPLPLAATRTCPGAWYWENHPTSKSPWATGDVSVTVVVDIGAVENAAPWTKVGAAAAGPARAAPRNRAKPGYRMGHRIRHAEPENNPTLGGRTNAARDKGHGCVLVGAWG